jgi:hypothetical protein
LRKILAALEKGDPIEAAGVVAEMKTVLKALPVEISERDADEAGLLLGRCVRLEQTLREGVLASMRQLGAARKLVVYRHGIGR